MKKNYNKDEADLGLKRYIERIIQDREAEQEIKDFVIEDDELDDNDEAVPNNIR